MGDLVLEVGVVVTSHNNAPAIQLRKITNDVPLMKEIIFRAIHNKPIVIVPKFNDKLRSISSLIQKGILHYDAEQDLYLFNI